MSFVVNEAVIVQKNNLNNVSHYESLNVSRYSLAS